jgi:hypothetical protein
VDENLNSMITMAIPDEIATAFLMSPLTDAALNDSGNRDAEMAPLLFG